MSGVRRPVEALQLVDVGEQDVEAAVADQPQELVAVAVDAEGVREGQRDLVAGLVGDPTALRKASLAAGGSQR